MSDSPIIVTVTPTIMDGAVVRWYASVNAAECGDPIASASRAGVLVTGYLHEVPAAVMAQANEAFEILRDRDGRRGAPELVYPMATHRKRGLFGPLERIESDGGEPS